MELSPREQIARLLCPYRYWRRWRFPSDDDCTGGIPWSELAASCVRDPSTLKLLLLHKKVVRVETVLLDDGRTVEVADRNQKLPFCGNCYSSLSRRTPTMPKFALANDLWMGQMPKPLRGLSDCVWMMLAVARPFIQRMTVYGRGGRYKGDPYEVHRAFVGNTAVFPQADGIPKLRSLPPMPEDFARYLSIAFAGHAGSMKTAYCRQLDCDVEVVHWVYDLLRRVNGSYAGVPWNDTAAVYLATKGTALGVSETLQPCVSRLKEEHVEDAQVLQSGPADAVVSGCVRCEKETDGCPVAEVGQVGVGMADNDVELDLDRQIKQTHIRLSKQIGEQVRATEEHQPTMREHCPDYIAADAWEAVDGEVQAARRNLKALNLENLRRTSNLLNEIFEVNVRRRTEGVQVMVARQRKPACMNWSSPHMGPSSTALILVCGRGWIRKVSFTVMGSSALSGIPN